MERGRTAFESYWRLSLSPKTEKNPKPGSTTANVLTVSVTNDDNADRRVAELMAGPFVPNALAVTSFTRGTLGEISLDNAVAVMMDAAKRVCDGDLREVEAMLLSQASALNAMFADLVNRSAQNRREGYFDAAEKYLKLAFKAQNQSRMTLESLSAVKNPPVVYAKQANIAHGPQQINNTASEPSRTTETKSSPNKLLEEGDDQRVVGATPSETSEVNQQLEAMGVIDGAAKR